MSWSTHTHAHADAAAWPVMPGAQVGHLLRVLRTHPHTVIVIVVGLAARCALIPLHQGRDFVVWDLASRALLAGENIYAHHPPYPSGPYAYFPLFLYIELPMQWLSLHTGISFTILGKLPIIAGDLLTAGVIRAVWMRRGCGERSAALASALFFLNPLVLYNGTYYGRFDSLCLGLLLLAITQYAARGRESTRWAPTYALAVAMKTFPILLLPWLLRRGRSLRARTVWILTLVLAACAMPFVVASPRMFVGDVVLYNAQKAPGNLSWQVMMVGHADPNVTRVVGYALLGAFALLLIRFRHVASIYDYALVATLLFLVMSKVVLEQYLLWPLPFLILHDAGRRRLPATRALLIALTAIGMVVNPYIHPLGEEPLLITTGLAVGITLYVTRLLRVHSAAEG